MTTKRYYLYESENQTTSEFPTDRARLEHLATRDDAFDDFIAIDVTVGTGEIETYIPNAGVYAQEEIDDASRDQIQG